jgi:hypothetical protein
MGRPSRRLLLPPPPPSRAPRRADARAIHAAAKAGTIGSIATDDEVYDLVRSGHMSADDAMNRDF